MIDHDNLEEFRDPENFDVEDEGYERDWPLTEQWARKQGGPLLDLGCGTGRVALRYVFPQELEALLFYNGFQALARYGNWQQDPLTATSPSMIYVCQRRS